AERNERKRCAERDRECGFVARLQLRQIGAGECGALLVERPFELVAADRLLRQAGGDARADCENKDRRFHDRRFHGARPQSIAIITSDALITTVAAPPVFRPSSSTASLVMDDVITWPGPISTRTWDVVAPFLTARILPLI